LDTERGNEREVEAVEWLIRKTGIQFVRTGDEQVHVNANGIGATPDGVVYDDLDLITDGCEVKCRRPIHHARQLLIKDNATLLEHDFERYCQIQVACLVTGVDRWHSVNFNPYAKSDAHKFNYCIIERDDEFLAIFNKRAELVFNFKDAFLSELAKLEHAA